MAWCGTRRWALQAVRYALQQASLGQLLLPCTDLLTFHLRPRSIRVKVRVASSWWQHSTSSTTTVTSPRLRAFKASSDHGASNGGLEPNKKVASSLTVCASRLAIHRRCKSCNAPFSPPCHPRLETTLISRRTSKECRGGHVAVFVASFNLTLLDQTTPTLSETTHKSSLPRRGHDRIASLTFP